MAAVFHHTLYTELVQDGVLTVENSPRLVFLLWKQLALIRPCSRHSIKMVISKFGNVSPPKERIKNLQPQLEKQSRKLSLIASPPEFFINFSPQFCHSV